jgi:hypothetical protein
MADCVSFEYRDDIDVVLVKAGAAAAGSDLRNPFKDACNLLREKSGASFFIDLTELKSISEDDSDWIKQHYIPLVKRSCAGRIILIVPEDDPRREKIDEEYGSLIGFFFASDYESAVKVLNDVDLKENDKGIKIAGKTRKQWRDNFSYVWFKYSIFPIAIAIIVILGLGIFNKSKNDVIIYPFGYLQLDETYLEKVMKDEGFKVPYFPSAVVVMPNQEGKKPTEYQYESASAFFMTMPDIVVSDGVTYGYYYSSFGVYPESYDRILKNLSEEARKHVEPVYMSAREAAEYTKKYNAWSGKGDPDVENNEQEVDDNTKAIIGLRLNDTDACKRLGYDVGWQKSDNRLIFSMYSKCSDRDKAEKALTALLNSAY